MEEQKFTGLDKQAVSKENEFTRDGYKFTGFKVKDKDGNYLKDKDGNDLIVTSTQDFIEELKKQGNGGELTLEAQWEKPHWVKYVDPFSGEDKVLLKKDGLYGDEEPAAPATPVHDGYRFLGWDRSVDKERNVTYTAKWSKRPNLPKTGVH